MSLPLVAEGEFALVSEHLEAIANRPAIRQGFLVNDTVLHFMRADLAVLQRDEAALRKYAPLAAETAARDGHTLYEASAQRALGVLHRLTRDYAGAENHLQRALQTFQGLGTRWQVGRTLAELGELAAVRTDNAQARAHYARAIAAFDAMGAVPDKARTEAALRAL